MLCNNCYNKSICKYYDIFRDAPMILEIKSCEKYSGATSSVPVSQEPRIRKPIDYKALGIENELNIEENEDEERVIVDLSQETETKIVSITDLLLGGNDNEEKR